MSRIHRASSPQLHINRSRHVGEAARLPAERAERRVEEREVGRQPLERLAQELHVLVAEAHLVDAGLQEAEGGAQRLEAEVFRIVAAGAAPAAGKTGMVKPDLLNTDSSEAKGSPKTAGGGRGTASAASRKELGPAPLAPSKTSAAVLPGREAPAAGRNRKGRFASSSDEEPRGVAMGRSLLTCL